MSIQSINPANEEVIAQFEPHTSAQVDEILDQAQQAFLDWRLVTFAERSGFILRVAGYLRAHKASLARIITQEMRKPITEAEAEIEKSAWGCVYYAERAERILADEHIGTNATKSYVAARPLGVILAVMPWNFPFWQVFRFAAPALMAGNTAILKHASNVSQSALAIERIFQ